MSTAGAKDRAGSFPAGKGRLPKEGELRPLPGQREKIPLTVAFCGELWPDCITRPGPGRPGTCEGAFYRSARDPRRLFVSAFRKKEQTEKLKGRDLS